MQNTMVLWKGEWWESAQAQCMYDRRGKRGKKNGQNCIKNGLKCIQYTIPLLNCERYGTWKWWGWWRGRWSNPARFSQPLHSFARHPVKKNQCCGSESAIFFIGRIRQHQLEPHSCIVHLVHVNVRVKM